MGIELIHANSEFIELGIVCDYSGFDAVLSMSAKESENDYLLELPSKIWESDPIAPGDYIYISGTEWGGPVTRVRHTDFEGVVRVYGLCWRGLLCRSVVCPPSSETHMSFSRAEANEAISAMLGSWCSELFSVSTLNSGLLCSGEIRYRPLLDAVYTLLDSAGARLSLSYENAVVSLEALPTRDRRDDLELSQEYEADIISEKAAERANHIIALGMGQMLQRTVLELWLLPDGSITSDPNAEGIPDRQKLRTLLYDYSAVESVEELEAAAKKKLREAAARSEMEISLRDGESELELTDIVSVRDSVAGLSAVLRVVEKNLQINENGISIKYKLGELA